MMKINQLEKKTNLETIGKYTCPGSVITVGLTFSSILESFQNIAYLIENSTKKPLEKIRVLKTQIKKTQVNF